MESTTVSPIIRYPSSRTKSYTDEYCQFKVNIGDSNSKTEIMDFSDLTNKFIIIPEAIFTSELNVLEIDDTFILRNLVCKIFRSG